MDLRVVHLKNNVLIRNLLYEQIGNAEATDFLFSLGCESFSQCIFEDYTSGLSPEGLFSFETLLESYSGLILIQIQCEKEVVQPCSVRPRHECYSMMD